MPRLFPAALAALGVSILISCERAAQPVPNASQISPQSAPGQPASDQGVSATAESGESADSAALPSDSLIVADTTGADFTGEDLAGVKKTLEAALNLDQFTASGPATRYGKPCRFFDTTSVRRYSADDIRFAYVRPRLLKIAFAGDDHYVKRVDATAEITRIALLQRGVDGKWHGSVNVTRDTLSILVSSSVADTSWLVCEKPAHFNGWNSGGSVKPSSAWIPVRATDTEKMGVVWDDQFNASKLARLADSVSRLPVHHVVEGNPEPRVPIVYKDICQYEGCSFGEWLTCDTARIFTEPKTTARTAFVFKRGDRFTAVTADMYVRQAGMVVFKRNVKIQGEASSYYFTPADTLYPLMYGSEGGGIWYFRGKEAGGDFFFGNGDADDVGKYTDRGYDLVRPIISEWWVRVRAKDGREGWFMPGDDIYGRSPHYEDPMPDKCPAKKAD